MPMSPCSSGRAPCPSVPGQEASGCLADASSRVGLFAQLLSWEQTGRSGKMGPTRAGLGQLNSVTGRHLPSQQEEGSWVHPGERREEQR